MQRILFILYLLIVHTSCAQEVSFIEPATAFLNSLNSAQKEKALVAFDDENRTRWHYFPSSMYNREGISIKELNEKQRELLHNLLHRYLSVSGYNKTNDVFEVEAILRDLTHSNSRDPDLYYISIYKNKDDETLWGWSLEGHHLSLNFTADGKMTSYTPLFFGANPAIVKSGPQKGRRSLKNEEDLALKLINHLDREQREKAIFKNSALYDIESRNDSEITPLKTVGITASELNEEQQAILIDLIMEYISTMPEDLAQKRMVSIKSEDFKNIHFAWAGTTELREPHYYRIQGKTFLIEFDNTQDHANHIHSVWRDFNGDFGRDLIKEHYKKAHHH